MSIPNCSPVREEPSSTPVGSSHRRTVTVAATVVLATAFTFMAAPAAFAAPASVNKSMSYAQGDPNDGCTGNCSWPCSLPCGNCACEGGGS